MSTQLVTGRYRVERPLGHGAMSTVDLAVDLELDRNVALKRLAENLSRDDDLRARFKREARLAARLAHPNLPQFYMPQGLSTQNKRRSRHARAGRGQVNQTYKVVR